MQRPLVAFALLDETITAASKPNHHVKIVRLTADTTLHDRVDLHASDSVERSIDVPESVRCASRVWAIIGRLHDERSQGGLLHTQPSRPEHDGSITPLRWRQSAEAQRARRTV